MNEEAQKVLADMLQSAMNGMDAAVEFGMAEIPVVVEQLLMWHAVKAAIIGFSGLLLIAASSLALIWIARAKPGKVLSDKGRFGGSIHEETIFYDRDGDSTGAKAISVFLSLPIMAGFIMAYQILTVAQILIAPKLYLLEYGASLVK